MNPYPTSKPYIYLHLIIHHRQYSRLRSARKKAQTSDEARSSCSKERLEPPFLTWLAIALGLVPMDCEMKTATDVDFYRAITASNSLS